MASHFAGFHNRLLLYNSGLLAKTPIRSPVGAFQNFDIILLSFQMLVDPINIVFWIYRTRPLIASLPKSIRKPMESRLVKVISIGQFESPIVK
jgi:hypothetical protein